MVPGPHIRDCTENITVLYRFYNCEHNSCDIEYNFWALWFGFRIGHIWALSRMSHNPDFYTPTISWFPCNFLQTLPINFCVITIHQVIWPSPWPLNVDTIRKAHDPVRHNNRHHVAATHCYQRMFHNSELSSTMWKSLWQGNALPTRPELHEQGIG